MKTTKIILGLMISIMAIGCKKDDDSSAIIFVEDSFEEIVLPQGRISLKNNNKLLELSFENGMISEEKNLPEDQKSKNYNGDIFSFSANVIQRTAKHPEERSWSKEFPVVEGESNKIHEASVVFSGSTMFISYQIVNTTTYSSTYFVEAIDIFNSDTLWKVQMNHKTELHMYESRFITVQRTDGNRGIIFQYRNKVIGDVEAERRVEDRVDRYLFDGDLIIATSWQNRVFALDRSLNMVWSFNTDGANTIFSLIHKNQFVFRSRDGHLYALDKNSGSLNWKKELSESPVLGIHANDKNAYVGQLTADKTLTISTLNIENGEIHNAFETAMSDDYYTTRLNFHKAYLLLVTSPTSSESDIGIEAQLIHLPNSSEVWKTNLNLTMSSLQVAIETYSGNN